MELGVFQLYSLVTGIFAVFYVFFISRCITTWNSLPEWKIPPAHHPQTRISVVIAARNEEAGIKSCIDSLLQQNYPAYLFEIIIVDDHSADATAEIVVQMNNPRVQLLQLSDFINKGETQSFKKKAIETGIAHAGGELIVTTDADCVASVGWLHLLASYYEAYRPKFIAAPVSFFEEKNLLERFQSLDILGMMLISGAGIRGRFMHMCNGANLAYPKAVFREVGGFEGIDHLASGDDILLMQKVAARYPGEIGFVKNRAATVFSRAKPDITSFLRQRLRWATKSTSYKEWRVTFFLAMTFFFCSGILLSAILIPFLPPAGFLFLALLAVKLLTDFFFLKKACAFFHRNELMKSFLPGQFLHIAYIVVLGVLGNIVKRYEWKGRKVV